MLISAYRKLRANVAASPSGQANRYLICGCRFIELSTNRSESIYFAGLETS